MSKVINISGTVNAESDLMVFNGEDYHNLKISLSNISAVIINGNLPHKENYYRISNAKSLEILNSNFTLLYTGSETFNPRIVADDEKRITFNGGREYQTLYIDGVTIGNYRVITNYIDSGEGAQECQYLRSLNKILISVKAWYRTSTSGNKNWEYSSIIFTIGDDGVITSSRHEWSKNDSTFGYLTGVTLAPDGIYILKTDVDAIQYYDYDYVLQTSYSHPQSGTNVIQLGYIRYDELHDVFYVTGTKDGVNTLWILNRTFDTIIEEYNSFYTAGQFEIRAGYFIVDGGYSTHTYYNNPRMPIDYNIQLVEVEK